jgi:GT2 family glycosyltransferase
MRSEIMKQKVSVQIVTYNSAEHIISCLQAVFAQSYPIAQVIVVDNASTDATHNLLEPYSEKALLLYNECNIGFAPAHNQALFHSIGDYVLVLNPDVILQHDYVAHLIEFMSSRTQVGSTAGKLLLKSSPSTIDSTGLVINKARRAFDRYAGKVDPLTEKQFTGQLQKDENVEIFGVSGAAAMYSRNMIAEVMLEGQFFDEAFFAYKEDVDVAWRAQLYGWTSFYVPQAVAYHERGWKSGSRSKQPLFIRRYSYINRYRMMLKNDQLFFIIRHIFYIISFELASFGYILIREPALLNSWVMLFRDLPHILRQRKEISIKSKPGAERVYRFFN